jgi:predicted Fe-Mo cluster-binding NifX family protein
MKFLIATLGSRLDSYVAKRFEHAAWYLIVDSDTTTVDATRHLTPQDRHLAFQKAARQNVDVVVAGNCRENTLKQIRAHNMRLAHAHWIDAAFVLAKIKSHDIIPADSDELENEKRIPVDTVQRGISKGRHTKSTNRAMGFASDTARGHHHLQQYGGRGH